MYSLGEKGDVVRCIHIGPSRYEKGYVRVIVNNSDIFTVTFEVNNLTEYKF